MKNQLYVFSLLILLAACSTDDGEPPEALSDAKEILSFGFLAEDNPNELADDIEAEIDGNTITALVLPRTPITSLFPRVTVSEEASFSPEGPQNFSNPVTYTVTAEDGSTATYSVTVEENETDRMLSEIINYFRFLTSNNVLDYDVEGVIIDEENKIVMTVPEGTDLTNLVATLEVTQQDGAIEESTLPALDYTDGQDIFFEEQDGSGIFITIEVLEE